MRTDRHVRELKPGMSGIEMLVFLASSGIQSKVQALKKAGQEESAVLELRKIFDAVISDPEKAFQAANVVWAWSDIGIKARSQLPLIQTLTTHADLRISVFSKIAIDNLKTAQQWGDDLRSQDPKTRRAAADRLKRMNREALPALPVVIETIEKYRTPEVEVCLLLLTRLGPEARDAVSALIALLGDTSLTKEQTMLRLGAAMALGAIGPEANSALPALRKTVQNATEQVVRIHAFTAIKRINPDDKTAIPALLANLSSNNLGVQVTSLTCLGMLGKDAETALPKLNQFRKSQDPAIQALAEYAIARIQNDSDGAKKALGKVTSDKRNEVRTIGRELLEYLND